LKHLLIVYHSQTGNTEAMARAVYRGATSDDIDGTETRSLRAGDADEHDLLWADGILIGTPENFGYMSGAIKDFLDRTFYPVEGRIDNLPYAMFVSAGNDGTGAVASIRRIAQGYPFREVHDPVIARGELTPEALTLCETLGTTLAAGLELGIF
jgi:multimeric flavodoxin WrbA